MRKHGNEGRGSPRLARAERNADKKGIKALFGKHAAKGTDIIVPEYEDNRSDERKALSAEAERLRQQRRI
nr:hypothetical protein [Candidatus Sigynarchaeum springense]